MEKLKMTFHGKSFTATLLEKEAPNMIKELRKVCPFQTRIAYAKICMNEIFFQAPIARYEVENPVYSLKGHVAYYAPKQTICIWYGDTPSLGDCDLFALLEESQLEAFKEAADQVWEQAGDIMLVEIVEEEA